MNWTSWTHLSADERRKLLADRDLWQRLSAEQQADFLANARWQELRHVPEAKRLKLEQLVPLEDVCAQLDLDANAVAWLISTRKLPGWLVGGAWKFDLRQLQRWITDFGGIAAVQRDVQEQMLSHGATTGRRQ